MTLAEFKCMDKRQQIKRFWSGVFLGQRFEGQYWVQCRQIDGFYVEYKIFENSSRNLRLFQNPDLLQPYLHNIDIQALFA